MEKNYYEILEIDINASPEIIKKAYSTLAKKYHPDLQSDEKKHEAEEKFKLINEAYEVLSDEIKKTEYDSSLPVNTVSKEQYTLLYQENENLKNIINELNKKNLSNQNNTNISQTNTYNIPNRNNKSENNNFRNDPNYFKDYENILKKAYDQAYYDAYIQDLKNRGYKIQYKKTFKDHIKNIVSLLLTIFIIWLLLHLPFVQNFLENFSFKEIFNIY